MSKEIFAFRFRWATDQLAEPKETARSYGCLFVPEEHIKEGVWADYTQCVIVGPTVVILLKFLLDIGLFDDVDSRGIAESIRNMKYVSI